MLRWICSLTAAAALIGTGIVHGFWTNRWVEDTTAKEAGQRLAQVPMKIGEWEGTTIDVEPGPGIAGSIQRSYVNRRLGITVNVTLVTGQPGPVATHTPEVCFGASGFNVGKRERIRLDFSGPSGQFWTADAVKTGASDEKRIRLYWAWNPGSGWVASEDARKEFPRFRHPVLHKLYVIRDLSPFETRSPSKDEPCIQFLHVLIPELEKQLFAPSS